MLSMAADAERRAKVAGGNARLVERSEQLLLASEDARSQGFEALPEPRHRARCTIENTRRRVLKELPLVLDGIEIDVPITYWASKRRVATQRREEWPAKVANIEIDRHGVPPCHGIDIDASTGATRTARWGRSLVRRTRVRNPQRRAIRLTLKPNAAARDPTDVEATRASLAATNLGRLAIRLTWIHAIRRDPTDVEAKCVKSGR